MRRLLAVILVFALTPVAAAQQPAPTATPAATPAPEPTAAPVTAAATTSAPRAKGEDVITPLGAVWRSTLVPGWGQRYKGEKTKGWVFTGIAAAGALASIASYKVSSDARSYYKHLGPGTNPDEFDRADENQVNTAIAFQTLTGATATFWALNIADSGFKPLEHVRIKNAQVKDVFPAISKYYESNPIAVISLENRSAEPVRRVKVKFEAKDIMDVPAESEVIDQIPPGLGKSVTVTAAFSQRILDVATSEPRPLAAKITIEYEVGRKKRDITRTATFTAYNRNAIVWDDMRKLAAFVTPREENVRSFAGQIASMKPNISAVKSINTAAAYFDALGSYKTAPNDPVTGITYVSDPQAPFAYFDGNAEAVDGVNYPLETLRRRTGDCDDLSALYASLLESSGVATALVDVPGHVFVMFDSELSVDEARNYLGEGFVPRNGKAWIPVETTAVGKSFEEARRIGMTQVKKWTGLNQFNVVEVASAQSEFPASPPPFEKLTIALNSSKLNELVKKDQLALSNTEKSARDKAIAEIKSRNLSGAAEANEIGIVYAKEGKFADAERQFRAAIAADSGFAKAYNNLGNLYYLQGNNAQAKDSYSKALQIGGDNAAILANMATMHFEEGNANEAKRYFERAVRLEPVYEREYPEIAALIHGDAKVAAKAAGSSSGKAAGIGVGGRDPRKSKWTP